MHVCSKCRCLRLAGAYLHALVVLWGACSREGSRESEEASEGASEGARKRASGRGSEEASEGASEEASERASKQAKQTQKDGHAGTGRATARGRASWQVLQGGEAPGTGAKAMEKDDCLKTMKDMTTPGVEAGLSRPRRDVLTTRRCSQLRTRGFIGLRPPSKTR